MSERSSFIIKYKKTGYDPSDWKDAAPKFAGLSSGCATISDALCELLRAKPNTDEFRFNIIRRTLTTKDEEL